MAKLKVCGINDAAIAREATRLGVDYLGLIFAGRSPRYVDPQRARAIADDVRSFASGQGGMRVPRFVGVFVGGTADEILDVARIVHLDVAQLHFVCEDGVVDALKLAGLEVWRLHGGPNAVGERDRADALLLDGRDGGRTGGTGKCADWSLVAGLKAAGNRVVLAGGISAANVADAVATGADVIDANSSIETSPGVKSVEMLAELVRAFGKSSASLP